MGNLGKMKKKYIWDARILQIFLFAQSIVTIFALRDYAGDRNVHIINTLLLPTVAVFMIARQYKLSSIETIYVAGMSFGFMLHVLIGVDKISDISNKLFARIVPVLLLSVALHLRGKPKLFIAFFFLFYILECGLAVYEKVTLDHYYPYKDIDSFMATTALMDDSASFRSYSLMLHPLFNANTVSVCLAFVLCSNRLKSIIKIALIALGLFALWGINSRGAMIIWGIILLYRIALYKAKLAYTIVTVMVLYFALPPLIEWLLFSGVFGRLADFDFSDSSTLTRFEAFNVFQAEKWDFNSIIAGGKEICYPGTQVTLENGFLLDLGYWGLVVGSVKIIGELLITYKAIGMYAIQDRIILLMAVWGVAFMNNNSYNTWLMPVFVMATVCYNDYMPYRKK